MAVSSGKRIDNFNDVTSINQGRSHQSKLAIVFLICKTFQYNQLVNFESSHTGDDILDGTVIDSSYSQYFR